MVCGRFFSQLAGSLRLHLPLLNLDPPRMDERIVHWSECVIAREPQTMLATLNPLTILHKHK